MPEAVIICHRKDTTSSEAVIIGYRKDTTSSEAEQIGTTTSL